MDFVMKNIHSQFEVKLPFFPLQLLVEALGGKSSLVFSRKISRYYVHLYAALSFFDDGF
jgi:hypothetical protein